MVRGHLQNLVNFLRCGSRTLDGRVSRVRYKLGKYDLKVQVQKSGSIKVELEDWDRPIVSKITAITRGESEIILKGTDLATGKVSIPQAACLKALRRALNDAFPMYWYGTKEWSPPKKPINQRNLPTDKGKRK